MAVFGGSGGTVTWTGKYVTNVFAWEGSIDFDVHVYLTFAAADAKGSIQGAYNMTGTLSCYLDDAVGADVVASGTAATALLLTGDTGVSFGMNAVLSRLAPAVSSQTGPGTITVGFVSDGAVTILPA